jgi:hypothetical protein
MARRFIFRGAEGAARTMMQAVCLKSAELDRLRFLRRIIDLSKKRDVAFDDGPWAARGGGAGRAEGKDGARRGGFLVLQ